MCSITIDQQRPPYVTPLKVTYGTTKNKGTRMKDNFIVYMHLCRDGLSHSFDLRDILRWCGVFCSYFINIIFTFPYTLVSFQLLIYNSPSH